jgi:hypothetical protein
VPITAITVRVNVKPLAILLTLGLLGVSASAATALTRRHTAAGDALAAHRLLRRADFGRGWSTSGPPRAVPALTCPRFSPATPHVTESGAAVSPTFSVGSSGPFVGQSAYEYGTGAQRATFWRAVARPGLLRCVADSLSNGSASGVRFTVTGKRLLALPSLSARAIGFRVSGTGTTGGQSVDVYLDVIVVGRGRSVAAISLSSLEQPVPRSLELRLARTVSARMSDH